MLETDHDISNGEALQEEARTWLRRLTSGMATPDDVEALERWRSQGAGHAQAFAEAALLWNLTGEAAKAAVDRNPKLGDWRRSDEDVHPARRVFIGGGAALAASLAGIAVIRPPLGLWPSLSELDADYRTSTGERRNVEVVSDVSVELNTRTSINLRHNATGMEAIELLTGEAVIEKQANPALGFVVYAGEGHATATQASFNIRKDDDTVCVTCIRGNVRVQYRQREAVLQERQQLSYDAQGIGTVERTDPKIVTAWQQGLLVFREVPLARVIDEVNRYRPGKIILVDPQLGRREVVADFRLDRLDAVLEFATRVMNARTRSLPGGIVLLG
jgi:transmembrane sensor